MFECLPHELERLRFRQLRRGDLDAFLAYRSDQSVARYQGWNQMSAVEAASFLEAHSRHASLVPGTWQQFGIADAGSDNLIGDVGLLAPGATPIIEFGISIRAKEQGKGYGTECVRGLVSLLFSSTPITGIVAHADVRNLACLTVLKKAGFHEIGNRHVSTKGEDCTELAFRVQRNGSTS